MKPDIMLSLFALFSDFVSQPTVTVVICIYCAGIICLQTANLRDQISARY